MKILVAYYSTTGNTKKIAEAIYQALGDKTADIREIDSKLSADEYALIFCGFPVQSHSVPLPAQEFLKKIGRDKKVAFFSTHGASKEGQMPREAIKSAAGLVQAEIIGTFTCRGEVDPAVITQLVESPQNRAWAMEAQSATSHPDNADMEDARFFAKSTLKKVLNFHDYS